MDWNYYVIPKQQSSHNLMVDTVTYVCYQGTLLNSVYFKVKNISYIWIWKYVGIHFHTKYYVFDLLQLYCSHLQDYFVKETTHKYKIHRKCRIILHCIHKKHALAESICTSRLDLGQEYYVTPSFLKKAIVKVT